MPPKLAAKYVKKGRDFAKKYIPSNPRLEETATGDVKVSFRLENLPVELLASVIAFLSLDDVNILYVAGTNLIRRRMAKEGAVRSIESVSETSFKLSHSWPITATKSNFVRSLELKSMCPYEKVEKLIWASQAFKVRLQFLPNTLTTLVLQMVEAHDVLMPYFTTVDDKPPTTLGSMFPNLHTLAIGRNPRRRVLGLVMYPLKSSPIDDFIDNLPKTLTSLHFDEYKVNEVLKRSEKLPKDLMSLGLNGERYQVFSLTPLPCFFQLTRLDVPSWRIDNSDMNNALSSAKLLRRLNICSIHPTAIYSLPPSLTHLGMQFAPHETTNPLAWPSTIVIFECHYLLEKLTSYHFSIHAQSIRILSPHNGDSVIATDFFEGSEHCYQNLSSLDLYHSILDQELRYLPKNIKRLELHSIYLSGALCEKDIPIVWGPSECRSLSLSWIRLHFPHTAITFFEDGVQYPISERDLHVPDGVQEIVGMQITRDITRLYLPPSLTSLPSSYGPLLPSEYDKFPNMKKL